MNTQQLQELCAAFPGARSQLHGAPSNILVYAVGEKKFAYFKTSEPQAWRFSIRVSAERFLELTDMPGIKPARYMGRFHWISIVDGAGLAPDYLAELVADSYRRALASLCKARGAAVTGGVAE